MKNNRDLVLVVGATGSIGRLVVGEALSAGYAVRALVRDKRRAATILPDQAELFEADLTHPASLADAVHDVTAIVFTHGSYGMCNDSAKAVDYGGVLNVMRALRGTKPRIALMTTIGVTKRVDAVLGSFEAHDWKRRAERLIRASGCPYTIVRPGWFDYNQAGQKRLSLLQGDTRWASNPSDGVVSRAQIAQVLVHSLSSRAATNCSFELVGTYGPATTDLDDLLRQLLPDPAGTLDAVLDAANMPLDEEAPEVLRDLLALSERTGTAEAVSGR